MDSALAPAFLSALDGRQLSNFRFMYYFVETPANHKPLFREPRNLSQIKWYVVPSSHPQPLADKGSCQ